MSQTSTARSPASILGRWWRLHVSGSVNHETVIERIVEESGWSPRFAFMTLMSAGIAVLGLLLSSPAVVIGAMLISPLMGPIMGLGFSLALFDFAEMRRSVAALALATALAIAFTAIVVLCSPLKSATAEILARTRPNLFDLLVALFSALAGAFALIRGRGETIVGVAIATALMPPLATVGYGLATANMAIAGGAFALFATNFFTIALAATIMARLYGFGSHLSAQQGWLQTLLLFGAFVAMAVPLGISLNQIAQEAVTTSQVRSVLTASFGDRARVTQLDVDFQASPIAIRAVIIVPKSQLVQNATLVRAIEQRLGKKVTLQADQVLIDPSAAPLDQERAAYAQAQEQARIRAEGVEISHLIAVAAGTDSADVLIDRDGRRAAAGANVLPGMSLAGYKALEDRIAAQASDWLITLTPPPTVALLPISFDGDTDAISDGARAALVIDVWAARRWNWPAMVVPGLVEPISDRSTLPQRRAAAIAAFVRDQGMKVVAGPAEGNGSRVVPVPPSAAAEE
ncbi:DUF389 domain-containing protein [Sphingomonas sp.]|uniref:DUF389 domain-containing protein n=1 Tax=Sphingomonas sp. TaxID=28214 RepID=UPI0025E09816|nr:DUF389 domain-containing protein [Sphingomonas sp.]